MVRKRRNWPFDDFDDFFGWDIEEEFERMRRMMDMMLQRAMEGDMKLGEPMVYGFSMRVGPDGKPIIQQFGNTMPRRIGEGKEVSEGFAREPLTDIMESDDKITITAELPGVSKEDIDLRVDRDSVTIRAERKHETERKGRNYYVKERGYSTFYRTRPTIDHLSVPDVVEILTAKRTKRALITHFSLEMLRKNPLRVAKEITEKTGVETTAAHDGMVLEV